MTIKNIPLLYITFIVLSVTHQVHSFPVPEDAVATKPTFEPPREVLAAVNNDVTTPSPGSLADAVAVTAASEQPTPTQAITEKLAHNADEQPSVATLAPTVDAQSAPVDLEEDVPAEVAPTPTEAPLPTSENSDTDDIVIPQGASVSVPIPLADLKPTTLAAPAVDPAYTASPTESPDEAALESPTTVLTMTPTFQPTASAAQFFSISANPDSTFTSFHRTVVPTATPSVPLPSEESSGQSDLATRSRRTAVVGSLVALGFILSLVAFAFCFRCQCCRRRKSTKPLDLFAEDPERESLSSGDEKGKMSPFMSPTLGGVNLPVLRTHAPHTVTFAEPPDGQAWQAVAHSTQDGHIPEAPHVITGDSFMEIDLSSHSNLRIVQESEASDVGTSPNSNARASAGAASTAAQSYSTRASMYSNPASIESGHAMRASTASFDKLNHLASLATSPPPGTRARGRSKTVSSSSSPRKGAIKKTKSLPSITSYDNRFSMESFGGRSRKTTSGESEWDVAHAYGARYSKESRAGGSILSTVSEATMESMEAVEVGGKQCVLMKGRF